MIFFTLVRFATVCIPPAVLMVLILIGRLLTADNGIAFNPFIWIGIAPCGKVLPAKEIINFTKPLKVKVRVKVKVIFKYEPVQTKK